MSLSSHHDWHLREWIAVLRITQAELDRLTDWGRRKTSDLMTGTQRYNRDTLNEAANALNLSPFELLMPPAEAMAIRRLRDSALTIAAETSSEYRSAPKEFTVLAR